MTLHEIAVLFLLLAGLFFFAAGSIGLIRFPDAYTRLHALTKADNLGLGLVVAAVALHQLSVVLFIKLAAIQILVLIASSTVSHLIAQSARKGGIEPWRKP